ncbi:hypothetical protein NDU88_006831 [Pleurodeles waltl]|uniref:Uncharacterized protein n=1 Tax=Pleurodeles waltl TaxID=8319 RepID=A0AAV7RP64_PLEWA|nr:hypothetical protein NDU88_006831 [Pleurodeles waltl]
MRRWRPRRPGERSCDGRVGSGGCLKVYIGTSGAHFWPGGPARGELRNCWAGFPPRILAPWLVGAGLGLGLPGPGWRGPAGRRTLALEEESMAGPGNSSVAFAARA